MRKIAAYIAVVGFTAGALLFQQHNTAVNLKGNQREACKRGNVLRRSVQTNEQAIRAFLKTAEDVRRAAAADYRKNGDLDQARLNQKASDEYRAQRLSLQHVELVDCDAAIT